MMPEVTPAQRLRMEALRQQEPRVNADLDCPDCGAKMVLRIGRFGRFYGCAKFRKTGCRGGVTAQDDGTPAGIPAKARVRALRKQIMDLTEAQRASPSRMGWPIDHPDWPVPDGVGRWNEDDCHQALKLLGVEPVVEVIPPATCWERLDQDMFD